MPLIKLTLTDEQSAALDERAAREGKTRAQYMRMLLFSLDRPVDEVELHMMVAAKAREGNMRAIEILARTQSVSPMSAPQGDVERAADDPFAEVDELAERRRTSAAG